jgi:hypothetical protein
MAARIGGAMKVAYLIDIGSDAADYIALGDLLMLNIKEHFNVWAFNTAKNFKALIGRFKEDLRLVNSGVQRLKQKIDARFFHQRGRRFKALNNRFLLKKGSLACIRPALGY